MRRLPKILPWLALLVATVVHGAVTIECSFNPQSIRVGENAYYQIRVNGTISGGTVADLPEIDGLQVSDTPNVSRSTMDFNGRITMQVTYSYLVRPSKLGTYTMPPVAVRVAGTDYFTPAATLKVLEADQVFNNAVQFDLVAPKQLYVGQEVEAGLRIRTRSDLEVRPLTQMTRKIEGFTVSNISDRQATSGQVNIGGTTYDEQTWPLKLSAIESGPHSLSYSLSVRIKSGWSYQDVPLEARATISVVPFPPGAPDSFNGAVGSFTLTRKAGANSTRVGEPVEVTVDVAGTGNFDALQAPKLADSQDWRAYPPSNDFTPTDELGLKGHKRFRFLVTPLHQGDLTTPELDFTYLDPDSGEYVTRKLPGEAVTVAPAPAGTSAPLVAAGSSFQPAKKEVTENPDALHPIDVEGSGQGDFLTPVFRRPIFLYGNLVPPVVLALLIGWRVSRRAAERNPAGRRSRAARRAARGALKRAQTAAGAGHGDAFRDAGRDALRQAVVYHDPAREPATVSATDVLRFLGDDANGSATAVRALFMQDTLRGEDLPHLSDDLRATLERLEVHP